MGLTNEELLRKAVLDTSAFGGANEAPLTVEQVDTFLQIMTDPQVMLSDVRIVTSNAATWEESKIEFGSRMMRPGSEGTRLAGADMTAPSTGTVNMVTSIIKGEVPVTDEVMEDQVERDGFSDTLTNLIGDRAGRDIEELFIAGDTSNSATAYLALQDGWLQSVVNDTGANVYAAAGDGTDYQTIMRQLLGQLSAQFKRDLPNMRYWLPQGIYELYRDQVAARGTVLGDAILQGIAPISYQGIPIKGVPLFPLVTTGDFVGSTYSPPNLLLSHRLNLYAGFRRAMRIEMFRDPREGATSFIVTARVAPRIAHVAATAVATSVATG